MQPPPPSDLFRTVTGGGADRLLNDAGLLDDEVDLRTVRGGGDAGRHDDDAIASGLGTDTPDGEGRPRQSIPSSSLLARSPIISAGAEIAGLQAEKTDQSSRENGTDALVPDASETRTMGRVITSADNSDSGTGAPIRGSDGLADDALLGPVADGREMATGATTGTCSTGVAVAILGTSDTGGMSPATAPPGQTAGAQAGNSGSLSPTLPAGRGPGEAGAPTAPNGRSGAPRRALRQR